MSIICRTQFLHVLTLNPDYLVRNKLINYMQSINWKIILNVVFDTKKRFINAVTLHYYLKHIKKGGCETVLNFRLLIFFVAKTVLPETTSGIKPLQY